MSDYDNLRQIREAQVNIEVLARQSHFEEEIAKSRRGKELGRAPLMGNTLDLLE